MSQPPKKSAADRQTQQIFDLMIKLIIQESTPTALIHWINGLFQRHFPLDTPVRRSPTETVAQKKKDGKLGKNNSDIILTIGDTDFHIESQIEDDDTMVLRVFEYGFARAKDTKTISEDKRVITLRMPEARILYLESTKNTPDVVTLKLEFPGGGENGEDGSYEYKVKTFKLLEHSLEELEQKDLTLLTPLYALKYRKALKASKAGSEERKALVEDARELSVAMEKAVLRSEERKVLTRRDVIELFRHIDTMYHELYDGYTEFKEVQMDLYEKFRSHYDEDQAAAQTRLLNEMWRLHADGMSFEQALQHVQTEIGTPALAAPREAAR